jgi:hypothetical protein
MPSRAFDESAMTVTTYPTVCARNLLRTPSTNEGAIGGCERTHPNQPYSCIRELFVDGLPAHAQGLQGGHCQAGKLLLGVAQDKSCVPRRTNRPGAMRGRFASTCPGLRGGHGQAGKLLQTGGFGLKAIAGVRQGIFSSDKFCKFVLHRRSSGEAGMSGRVMGRASAPLQVFRHNTGLILCYVLMPLRAFDDSDLPEIENALGRLTLGLHLLSECFSRKLHHQG